MDNFNPPPHNNPYSAPVNHPSNRPGGSPGGNGKIVAPGIALIVVATLGIMVTIFNIVFALFADPVIDPNAPEFFQEMARNSVGPFAAAVQGIFLVVNLVILFGGIQMIRIRSWGLCLAASIMAIINIGGMCCLLGAPVGIWSIVILAQSDVKQKMS